MRSITYQHDHDHDDCEMQKLPEDGSIDYVRGKEVSKHSIDFKGSGQARLGEQAIDCDSNGSGQTGKGKQTAHCDSNGYV